MYEKYNIKNQDGDPSKIRIVSSEQEEAAGKGIILDEEDYLKRLFEMSPEEGFDLLFRKYYGKLCSYCVRFVHSKAIAEDIVSEIFTNFWQKKVYEKIDTSFRAYLYRSVQFRSYNFLKKEFLREVNEPHDVDFAGKERVEKPDDILFYHELAARLDKIIRNLPSQCRKAFQMSRLEGMKYSEIANEMNLTLSAVEKLISRALVKIKAELRSDSINIL